MSWFKAGWFGSHQFKGGIEFEDSDSDFKRYSTGPLFFHYMAAGQPVLALFWSQADGVTSRYAMNGVHFFVQDSWSLSRRITLNLGMRINTWRAHWPEQSNDGFSYGTAVNFPAQAVASDTTAIEWAPVEPRLAINWALDDRGATVVRFGASRYHHGMDMSYFSSANPMGTTLSIHPWVDFDGDRFADANEVFTPIATQVSGGPNNPIDPDLQNPHTDEITIGVARELFQDASLTVNATWRRDHELVDDVGSNSLTQTYQQAPTQDPGEDGRLGTPDDKTINVFHQVTGLGTPNRLITTNPDRAKREYIGGGDDLQQASDQPLAGAGVAGLAGRHRHAAAEPQRRVGHLGRVQRSQHADQHRRPARLRRRVAVQADGHLGGAVPASR